HNKTTRPSTYQTRQTAVANKLPNGPFAAPDHPRALAFHPVIAQRRVFVADANHVYSFDLITGRRTTLFDLTKTLEVPGVDGVLPSRSGVRYSLTYQDGYLYVRLGTQFLRPAREEPGLVGPDDSSSAILCLGPIGKRPTDPVSQVWTLRPPKSDKTAATIFEGTPLVKDNLLYVALWKQSGGAAATSIVCYRLVDAGTPELLWQRDVGKPGFNPASDARTRHDLLTLAGSNVVFCTHAGNVIALDARTGKPQWEYRYARDPRRLPPVGRDLTPTLFERGRIFAAPADSDRLLCLDAFTGRLLWDREGVDVVHLLGVTQGKLIATVAGTMRGIRGINIVSGSERFPDGWVQHDDGGEATFGRGVLFVDLIYWPTKHGLQFLSPRDGQPARQPVAGIFGNLAYADGCFVVTNATDVLGFVSEDLLFDRRPIEVPEPSLMERWRWLF
ncbi:MAG: PQQ-like beta-propeller repeat protein, partial [Planctomycetes bacterium]|nr:PQQ-like beta-propeller repeat protein [Planctomycetota bacterium]